MKNKKILGKYKMNRNEVIWGYDEKGICIITQGKKQPNSRGGKGYTRKL